MHWRVLRCQKNCTLIIECIDGLTILSESCIWLWNNQMHWRILEFLSKNCIWFWNNQMHWRVFEFLSENCTLMIECIDGFSIYLAISATDVMARFWLYDVGRQADGRTAEKQTDRKQTDRTKRQKWNDVCWLLKQASWFAKKWWKTTIQSWRF